MTRKIDGYCAWHPESGYMPVNDDGDIGVIADDDRRAQP